ncbi:hypothetical protein [Humibacter albus]|uniref:hypothetical protein n=1 Tax=Humibacter albus TaxID=427754 RepID=UPI000683FB4F|nr:hypothetical protein [Humibacter albus]
MRQRTLRAARASCAVIGSALTAVGVYFLLTTEPPAALVGLVVWLAAAVLLHDGVFAPAVHLVNRMLDHGSRGLPSRAALSVRILFGVGAMLTLVVVPELVAQARPHVNPTILVGDYAVRLAAVWGVILVVTALVVTWSAVRTHRRFVRRQSTRG